MAEQPNTDQFGAQQTNIDPINPDPTDSGHGGLEPTGRRSPSRRGADPMALLAGLATLCVAAYLLTDGSLWLPSVDPRWVIGGIALLGGLWLLVMSLRPGRRGR